MIWPWVGREKLIEAEKELAVKAAHLEIALSAIDDGNYMLKVQRESHEKEVKLHREIEATLREQVQDMAEKLSHLTATRAVAPVVDKFESKPKPPPPYSQALQSFVDAIAFEQSRELVEEDIERLRARSIDDEQILLIVSEAKND